ncbi:MAG: S-layer homology domain-containing protein [Clostridiales bacterium]
MKKRIFSILTALCLCLTLLPTMAAAEKTAGTATEVKTSDELVGALADHDKAVVKLVENTVTVAPSGKIESGTETKFMAKASNYGTISGGMFETEVTNNGEITGGMFNGGVTGSGTISQEREVSNEESFLAALADQNVTTIKLKENITVNATENVKELTVDRPITLEKGGEDNSRVLYLYRPLTIAESGALTLENGAYFYPLSSVEVYGKFTVGAGCGVLFEGENASLVINQGGTVTTQPAGENTISGLLSLRENAALTVDGTLVNNGRLSVSNMENLKKAASIGGDLILDDITITEDYTLDMKGCTLTIGHITFLDANLTVKNASRVDATGVTISGGSYYCPVTVGNAEGVITGGSFYGPVTVKKISDGTSACISGGTFYNELKGSYITKGCIVTFMNGSSQYAMQVVKDKASAPDAPVKSGYRFAGWYSGDAKWNFDTPVTENLTLTAKWEKIHISAPSAPRYDVAVSDGAHGSVSVSPKSASKGSTVTVTVTPDKGYALETLAVTDKNGNALDLTDKGGGQYTFTMPSGPVTVAATFMDDNTMLNFFVDVPAGAYYYDAVLWAAEGGIVTGTDAVHFSPDASCTRAQLVTFLWRAAGSPAVNYAMNFTDVDGGAYYAEAVRWAAGEKIVEGTTAETFAPDAAVTRAQVVTMLYRFAKAQGMDTTQGGMAIREFDDFDAVPAYALEAMDWAVNAGVLKGDNNRLLPQDNCTRAQIVTMLYRALGEK